MKTCYIAAPYSGTTDDSRAVWLAKLALAMGMAPVVTHPSIRLGVYGDDADTDQRARGLDAAKAIAMACDEAWCLYRDDGTMSDGCRHETWHRRYRGGTWAEWQAVARVLHPELLPPPACEPAPERKVAPPWIWNADLSLWERDDLARANTVIWDVWASDNRKSGGIGAIADANADRMKAAADAALRKDGWVLPEDEP